MTKKMSSLMVYILEQVFRIKTKAFTSMISGAFAEFGNKSVIVPPARIEGIGRISIGDHVYIGSRSWLHVLPGCPGEGARIRIGSGTSIGSSSVISAVKNITIEKNVLIATNVCIVDHIHDYKNIAKPIKEQGINKVSSIRICQNTWIGQNAVVLPGAHIGKNCVVGANSVVNMDIEDFSVAVGSPAKVIRKLNDQGIN